MCVKKRKLLLRANLSLESGLISRRGGPLTCAVGDEPEELSVVDAAVPDTAQEGVAEVLQTLVALLLDGGLEQAG